MILARTLGRSFTLHGPLPAPCIDFLRTAPRLPAPPERAELIEIEPRGDGLFAMRCSWGLRLVGSGRALTRALDNAIYRLAASDEGTTLSLNASVVRLGGTRLLLVGETGFDLSELTVALLLKGAAFEGTGLVFVRAGGVAPHPAKPRLRAWRLASVGLSPSHHGLPTLEVDQEPPLCAVDPGIAGTDWTVEEGPIAVLLFVERNDGGRSAMVRLRPEAAQARSMRSIRSTRRPDVRAFVSCRAMVERARSFRLSMGDPRAAADLVVAQAPRLLVDS